MIPVSGVKDFAYRIRPRSQNIYKKTSFFCVRVLDTSRRGSRRSISVRRYDIFLRCDLSRRDNHPCPPVYESAQAKH